MLQALYVAWLVAGFLSFGGELPGLPDYRVFDLWPEPWVTVVQVAWGLSLLAWPFLSVGAVVLAGIGALRAGRGRRFWYPVVSRRIRRLVEPAPAPEREPAPPETSV